MQWTCYIVLMLSGLESHSLRTGTVGGWGDFDSLSSCLTPPHFAGAGEVTPVHYKSCQHLESVC